MSTNYYVHTADGQEIHLGKRAAGWPFMFRGYPERGVMDYASWRAQFELGEIRDEYGRVLTPDEMEAVVFDLRNNWRARPHQPFKDDVDDADGNRFTCVEFC